MNSFLELIQKKGIEGKPHGLLTVYATVPVEQQGFSEKTSPLLALTESGFLVAQGNYRDQNSLKDFLRQELGTSIEDEEGMREFVEGLGGIEGALDPDKFKDKMNEFEEMQEFIPTPAKMVAFKSEEEILSVEGDVFYAGTYENTANANLAVNAVTILYQARYREAQIHSLRGEIDGLISQVESSPIDIAEAKLPHKKHKKHETTKGLTVDQIIAQLLTHYIPELIHSVNGGEERQKAEEDFTLFLKNYPNNDDVSMILSLTSKSVLEENEMLLVELYAKKIACLITEEFDMISSVVEQIKSLEG